MYKTSKEALEKRAEIFQQMEEMHSLAVEENRSFTKQEEKDFAAKEEQLKDLDKEIARLQLLEAKRKEMAATNGTPINSDGAHGHSRNNGKGTYLYSREHGEIRVYNSNEKLSEHDNNVGITPAAYLRALILGPKNEDERRTISNLAQGGSNTVPTPLANQIIDAVRAQSVVMRAGARTIPMESETLKFARMATDVNMAWRNQSETITEALPTFDAISLVAKNLGGLVKISREVVADSINADQAIMNAFVKRTAELWDYALLFGAGTKEPVGILNMVGIGALAPSGDVHTVEDWSLLVKQSSAIKQQNFNPTAFIFNPRTGELYGNLQATDKQPLLKPPYITDIPMLETTSVPVDVVSGAENDTSYIISGDFSKLYVGIRQNIELRILQELFAETNDIGIVATFRGDVVAERVQAFHVISGVPAPA